ncbi:MAG TPA: hypothetical protein VLH60_02270 [Sedimentisphaerales bacterium]|nr:hypothetical protein [Sedimentisphaerales bacterium]
MEEGVGAAHLRFSEVALPPIEDAAAGGEDLAALQFQVAALGVGKHLHGCEEAAVVLMEQVEGWVEKEGGPKKLFVVARKWSVKHFRH